MLSATHPPQAPRASANAEQRAAGDRIAYLGSLILIATSYQLWLCFLHTSFGVGGNTLVIAAEVAILAAALPLLVRHLPAGVWLAGALILANALLLALIREDFDAKPVRDILMPLVFLGVGINAAGEATADRVLRWLIWVAIAMGLFEFYFLDVFTRFFDVYAYYTSRGIGDPDMGLYRDDRLVASAIRPQDIGRTLMPFLGPHRASSLFLEPVSFGNFAVICAAWGLAKPVEQWRTGAFFVIAALVMMTLSDSRFAVGSLGLLILLRLLLVRGAEPAAFALPFLAVVAVILISIARGGEYSDSFLGRLTLTGRTLMNMPSTEIFGLAVPRSPYFDQGYPYILANFGLVACLALWGGFWMLPRLTDTARRFHVYVALYLSLILCVSGTSAFALKTSAPVWFLLGSLIGPGLARGSVPAAPRPARPVPAASVRSARRHPASGFGSRPTTVRTSTRYDA